MIKRSLKEIELMVEGTGLKEEFKNLYIHGVSTDSRTITKNQLFIPLVGENFNGHDFIEKAIEKGAVASLWNKSEPLPSLDFPLILVEDTLKTLQKLAKEYRKQLDIKVVGITGSNGKTSTKDILASILSTKYKTKKTMGNFNNHIGTPLTLLNLDEDTEIAVVEMGTDKFGEISLLTSLAKPDVAIITNIGEAHLEDLKTKENIARAKLEILEGLSERGLFIYFGDDPTLKKVIKDVNIKQKILTFGEEEHNDYRCKLIKTDKSGISFKLTEPKDEDFFLPMLGKHNMYNATAAITVARYFDIPYDLIREGFYHVEKTSMRNELVLAQGFTILNDSYKSNPSSLLAALDTLYDMEGYSQKIAVLGDMLGLGEDEIEMHEEVGKKIDPNKIDYLFTIGPFAKYIAKNAKMRFGKDRVITCNEKLELIEKLKKVLKPNSIILVKASRPLELEEVVDRLKKEVVLPKNQAI
ncbi:UDP-N-acetylmuramoyl-tripeptide--D-alanyl-D-alanine ligase [Tepidimicrobium xylanilyticum]|uniref:UDP-N-acetylmuramoyl-tripeptide--D-alanyl-D-alanine ligase n=1 Tax=Tepidimicrobium xylanilyticum TaxID=1123352 RepID=A0A1H3EQJ9_9FIRM|nr:UDP-N-acetylmuramoyl-tripeptide--D-alanyl-D-alanine ligase [Tepidimicrobium xylanilyticum]GMG97400.1 UDP-N-acetylmuramoyl-tripeptide--D-alanyl-D-alanine ligase [Tepidimicrobium xylanilyticum]SDX80219.1 UDP-N-acetylmuramoyl-tripeptide--D-alanyl-D-alanine ligase [Tepidimicrobium xylanilyticum]